jgi:acyl-coenzyme A synthetase/AMP-(fatty) acid ligase
MIDPRMSANDGISASFASAAARDPERLALVTSSQTVTYGRLLTEMCGMADTLRAAGVRPNDRVLVMLERGHGYVVVILALFMLGASVVPVDEAEPEARVSRLRAQVQPALTIGRRRPSGPDYLRIRDDDDLPQGAYDGWFADGGSGNGSINREAMVFSTSGSTGTPKLVSVPSRAVLAGARWCKDHVGFDARDVHIFKTAVSFTSVLRQVVWPLMTGGQVVILPGDRSRDLLYLGRLMHERGVTVSSFFPSHLGVLMRRDLPRSLRCVMMGGEPLTVGFVAALRPLTAARVLNVYGMTECNIISAADCADRDGAETDFVPLGAVGTPGVTLRRPDLSVIDDIEDGVEGELFVESDQAASGYLGLADETAARFPVDPATGKRRLRTGDLVEVRDGHLFFKERADNRVKIRGYSIDPSAVERCLRTDVGVNAAVVFKVDRGVSDQRLDAAVVTARGDNRDQGDLLTELRRYLPEYMIPSRVHLLDSLPSTPSGKADVQGIKYELGLTNDR